MTDSTIYVETDDGKEFWSIPTVVGKSIADQLRVARGDVWEAIYTIPYLRAKRAGNDRFEVATFGYATMHLENAIERCALNVSC